MTKRERPTAPDIVTRSVQLFREWWTQPLTSRLWQVVTVGSVLAGFAGVFALFNYPTVGLDAMKMAWWAWISGGLVAVPAAMVVGLIALVMKQRLNNSRAANDAADIELDTKESELEATRAELERARAAKTPKINRGRWEDIKTIKCAHVEYSPFLAYSAGYGDPVGFGPDLLRNLLGSLDIRVEFPKHRSTWSNILTDLAEKNLDVIATPLFVTYERSCDVLFTSPLFFCDIGLYANKEFASAWHLSAESLQTAIGRIANINAPKRFYYVTGEISHKLALKHHLNAELVSRDAIGEHVVTSCLDELATSPRGEGAFMFSEIVHAERAACVASGDVVNVLKQKSLLYPVAFAVRKGDYVLQNLLNLMILQTDGPKDVLDMLKESWKKTEGCEVRNFEVAYVTNLKYHEPPESGDVALEDSKVVQLVRKEQVS